MNETIRAVLAFARRWWLLVTVTTVAAAGVAGVVASDVPSTHTASVTLELNTLVLQRWPELGGVDTFVRTLRGAEFADAVAQAAGLGDGLGGGAVSAYSLGEPPNRVAVTFTSAAADDVEAVAPVLGEQAVAHFRTANAAAFERQQTLLDNDRAALDAMTPLKGDASGFDRLNAEYLTWSVKNAELAHAAQVRELEDACRMVSGPVVSETKPKAPVRDALGAGLLGLVAGIGIAYAADFLASRRTRS